MFWPFNQIFNRLENAEMAIETLSDAVDALDGLTAQLAKSNAEIVARLEEFEGKLAFFNVDPQTALDAFERLKVAVQAQDDIVPDQPPAE